MGWTLTGVQFSFGGAPVPERGDGNNLPWRCTCGNAAVLFIYRPGRAGSSTTDPARCVMCGTQYYLSPQYGFEPEPPAGDTRMPAAEMDIEVLPGD